MDTREFIRELFREESSDEAISAFTFKTAKLLEHIVEATSKNALKRNKELEAKILEYRSLVADVFHEDELKQYDEHFGIVDTRDSSTNGNEHEEHRE